MSVATDTVRDAVDPVAPWVVQPAADALIQELLRDALTLLPEAAGFSARRGSGFLAPSTCSSC